MSHARVLAVLLALAACAPSDPDTPEQPVAAVTPPPPAAHEPDEAERAEILAALQTVFDALATGDGALLEQVLDPDIRMYSVERAPDGSVSATPSTLEGLAERVTASEVPLIERMFDAEVRVDGALATVWTPYDFYRGEAFSHCGVDAATLVRGATGWSIVALSWTRRQPPDCPLHPDGPPGG